MSVKKYIGQLMAWFSTVVIVNVRDEDNYELKKSLRLSHLKVFLYVVFTFLGVFILSFLLIKTLLSAWFDPVHIRIETDKKMVALSYKIDSLEQEMNSRALYLASVKDVINGGVTKTDKTTAEKTQDTINDSRKAEMTLDNLSADEIEIRKEFENDDLEVLSQNNSNYSELSKFNFFVPLNGLITAKFDQVIAHYGVDIVAKEGATIQAISDGKVILSEWTKASGNVIIIQHKGSLISIYKHNSVLLKKVGSFVRSGEAIAIIGNSGELTSGPHLHVELWYAGNPINPQRFIPFE